MDANITKVLSDVLGIPESKIEKISTRDDIETWDSLAIINLAIALEAEFGVSLTAEEVDQLTSVAAIVRILVLHGARLG